MFDKIKVKNNVCNKCSTSIIVGFNNMHKIVQTFEEARAVERLIGPNEPDAPMFGSKNFSRALGEPSLSFT